MGRRKGPCTFCMQFVIYFEPQSIDFEGLTPLANENLRALCICFFKVRSGKLNNCSLVLDAHLVFSSR
ncbi:Phospholipid-Transporting Atpase Ic [Manis pentadactyla]|nr:Phospholipid-Transporting Atpase Ic [Manis pentadactyla]